jgi:RND family efflux transporter MFP subunit
LKNKGSRPSSGWRAVCVPVLGVAFATGSATAFAQADPTGRVTPVKAAPSSSAAAPTAPTAPTPAETGSAGLPLGCVIEPAQTSEVSATASGVLDSVLVERGAVVRKGQLLATLHSDVERAAYEAARARAASESEVSALDAARDLAKTKLRRMHALSQLDYGGRLELETAAAEFEIADHRLQQAREALTVARRDEELSRAQLEQRRVRSPIDGIVADRLLNPGERVDGRPIFRVVSLDRLRVEVVVPASRFGRIRPGMEARVTAEAADSPEVDAKVVQVDRFVDAASGTFRARLALSGSDRVPAGVRCRVAFAGEADLASAPPRPPAAEPPARAAPPRLKPAPAAPAGRT